jgi:pSer/pThr/pTyr-binding forkhead associated (FHA) protein
MISRALSLFLTGALAGFVGWAATEPFAPRDFAGPLWGRWELLYAAMVGALVCGGLGLVYGRAQGSRHHALVGLFGGLFIGAIGGPLGLQIGGWLSRTLFGDVLSRAEPSALNIPARMLVFLPIGAVIGCVFGLVARSRARLVNGVLGGLLGGALGGGAFDPIAAAIGPALGALSGRDEVGQASRAVGAVCVGGGIGLLVGLIELARRQAWVRVELGRNEGRDVLIDAPQSVLGRDERAHVPLMGDFHVIPAHAYINREGRDLYVLYDGGSPIGTGLNGALLTAPTPLKAGDVIQVGSHRMVFQLRSSGAPAARIADSGRSPAPQIQLGHGPAHGGGVSAPSAVVARTPVLVATEGPLAGQRFAVAKATEVGRGCSAIPMGFDGLASRRHARLTPEVDGLTVEDLGSTNGTMVDGRRISRHVLRGGESLRIGSTVFRLEFE